jgi:hypothetical protein
MNVCGEECPGAPPHRLCAGCPPSPAKAASRFGMGTRATPSNCTGSPHFLNKLFILMDDNRD